MLQNVDWMLAVCIPKPKLPNRASADYRVTPVDEEDWEAQF